MELVSLSKQKGAGNMLELLPIRAIQDHVFCFLPSKKSKSVYMELLLL